MYQEAGYGINWQPEANNARRFDPYTRPWMALACLFGIGFVITIIIVLSLIPLYMPHNNTSSSNNNNNNNKNNNNTNTQVSQISVNSYYLQFHLPYENFNSDTILSETNNQQNLQAALTSMIQHDSLVEGSIININNTTTKSLRVSRDTTDIRTITFHLNTISNRPCSSKTCLNEFQFRVISLLTNSSRTTSRVRYELTGSTQVYYLYFQLPNTIETSASLVYANLTEISSLLDRLILIDKNKNQPSVESTTANLFG